MNTPDPGAAPGPQTVTAFCQQCGQSLTAQTRRDVGGAVYCEPCLQARLAGAPAPGAYGPGGYASGVPGSFANGASPVPPAAAPNPRLAALLGFIPGVGAMYNEQYAKGIAHLAVFALLVLLSDANGIFGLFIAGWEFYMVIEAYHTAVARRDGMPLPNPFGFNELGDRLGFARGWTHPGRSASGTAGTVPPSASASPAEPAPSAYPPWNADADASGFRADWDFHSPYSSSPFGSGPIPPSQPVPPATPVQPPPATPLSRVPLGAVWLILLGLLFLLSTTGRFHEFSPESLVGWGLIALSGWIFLVRLRDSPGAASPTGRLHQALQPSAWVLTSGVLAILDGSGLLSWGRSWPIYLITAGVLALLGRLSPPAAAVLPAQPVPPASRPL